MTVNEKLYHFKEEATLEASQEGAALLSAHQKNLETEYKNHCRSEKHQSDMQIRLAKENLRREHNKRVSKAALDAKRTLTTTRMEIEDKLFSNISNMIGQFKKKSAYFDSLLSLISDAKRQAGTNNILVMIDESDKELLNALASESGVKVIISDENIVGGILATIPGCNLLIDSSYAQKLRDVRANLKLGGNYGN
ncbi:MAG: hypothetical protein K6F92_02105 [Lachnospiraceae bacterium]|nr:hypothetical protein [Lachnospiraceae bacterium]